MEGIDIIRFSITVVIETARGLHQSGSKHNGLADAISARNCEPVVTAPARGGLAETSSETMSDQDDPTQELSGAEDSNDSLTCPNGHEIQGTQARGPGTVEALPCGCTIGPMRASQFGDETTVADGGVDLTVWFDGLTAFQRDAMRAIHDLDTDPEPNGSDIKRALEAWYDATITPGRIYPQLDQLVDRGLVQKGKIDDRANSYELTGDGRALLKAAISKDADLFTDAAGGQAGTPVRTDGGQPHTTVMERPLADLEDAKEALDAYYGDHQPDTSVTPAEGGRCLVVRTASPVFKHWDAFRLTPALEVTHVRAFDVSDVADDSDPRLHVEIREVSN